MPSSVILVCRRFATYDDVPGQRYHFPRRQYENAIRGAEGEIALIYEPRRGGTSPQSPGGGRAAFLAWAVVGPIEADPERPDHAYVRFTSYQELPEEVPLRRTGVSGKALQCAVLPVDDDVVELVLRLGMAPMLEAVPELYGLTDLIIPEDLRDRPIAEVIRHQLVRERSFRYKVVDEAYGGTCVMSGMRLTNGQGRAEADAAHIMGVKEGGPDIVSNGLALGKTLHWAFDRGLLSVSDDGRILSVERGLPDGLRQLLRPQMEILKPDDRSQAPHPVFLAWHRNNVFKGIDR